MILVDAMTTQTNNRFHTSWRHSFAKRIIDQLDMRAFGVKSVYLFGSVAAGEAGPCSDIDLIFYLENCNDPPPMLLDWLEVWDVELCRLCGLRTGSRPDYMLDVHFIDDDDIRNRTSYAQKILSCYEPAELLREA